MDAVLKICVAGPSKSGKTCLARALAEQPVLSEYRATMGVRVQELSRPVGNEHVRVQLWDVSGNPQYQQYWSVLSQDADGLLLMLDAERPEEEKFLEQLYLAFAQAHSLTTRQCMVVGVTFTKDGSKVARSWTGLQGKLSKLQSCHLEFKLPPTAAIAQEAADAFNKLLQGCLAQKKEVMERAVVGD